MQQLKVEHKKITEKSTNNSKVVSNTEQVENIRERKGLQLALSRRMYRLQNSDTFYCESESTDNLYYFVRYEPSFHWCSCLDNSTRHIKCKHIFGLEFVIMKGTLKDIDKLPVEAKRDNMVPKSYRDDSYEF